MKTKRRKRKGYKGMVTTVDGRVSLQRTRTPKNCFLFIENIKE